ncbi:hypothetical protein [Halomonas elongata]|uniref:hypothetical protein n=1 Tax=Halomonas elongata TaxID=2746 RepID=UPI0023B1CA22|nr:hypothetical protein [Halomonas elongata]
MGFWKGRHSAGAEQRRLEEAIYEAVYEELETGMMRKGLWAKALANSDGNESQAKAAYIKLRATAMMDDMAMRAQQEEADREAARQQEKASSGPPPEGSWTNDTPMSGMKCSKCGAGLKINFGDAYHVLCSRCS